jgi:hypothetical protein
MLGRRFLYRGVSKIQHERQEGLRSKDHGHAFDYPSKWDESQWDVETWDSSATNAVVQHQQGQKTSGVSTSLSFRVARKYALHDGQNPEGFVYKIDRRLASKHGITEHLVKKYMTHAKVPKDEEVILESANFDMLPAEIVVAVRRVRTIRRVKNDQ